MVPNFLVIVVVVVVVARVSNGIAVPEGREGAAAEGSEGEEEEGEREGEGA